MRDGTPLGQTAKKFYDAGELVPDEVMVGLVKETLEADSGSNGFILDGFPRTLPQAEALDRMLRDISRPIDAVVMFDVADEPIVKRLGGRRSCPKCGAVYNVFFDAPRQEGSCDKCGSELVQRKDDAPETIQRRLNVYREQTAPVLDYYKAGSTPVHTLAGDQPIDQVQR